jgi:hypothetical protein
MKSKIDEHFTVDIEPHLEKIKEIEYIVKDKTYKVPVYLVKENELVNAIIKTVAKCTNLYIKYNCDPADITYFIKVFDKYNGFPVDRLNTLVQLMLKYKDLGFTLLLYPVLDPQKERILYTCINEITTNYGIVLEILRNLFKSNISYYSILYDKEYFYIREFILEGYLRIDNKDFFLYEALYPVEIDFINYIIKQNLKEPKNIAITKDKEQDKYLISWEY